MDKLIQGCFDKNLQNYTFCSIYIGLFILQIFVDSEVHNE